MKKLLLLSLFIATLPGQAAVFLGNSATGFGGVVGNGSLTLTDNTSTITGTFTRGGGGDFNDALVIYIDAGGTGANITDTNQLGSSGSDLGRRAIAAGSYSLAFPSGFAADYAIALGANSSALNFGGLWQLAANMDTAPFVDTVNLSPTGNVSNGTYTFSFDASEIGLVQGSTFNFVAAYLNPSNTFLSNETFVNGLGGSNPGFSGASFSGSANSYTVTAIPEPSRTLLGMMGLGTLLFRRRRA